MPTILDINGFRFIIWPADHEPPHVHVFKGKGEAKINIGDDDEAPCLITIYGLTKKRNTAGLGNSGRTPGGVIECLEENSWEHQQLVIKI